MCGVGAEGSSGLGCSGFGIEGGATGACDSGRGGATLFRTLGLILTFGPGGPGGIVGISSGEM